MLAAMVRRTAAEISERATDPGGTATDYTGVFPLFSGTLRDRGGQRGTGRLGS